MIITIYVADSRADPRKSPVLKWLYKLDKPTRAIIRTRIDRLKIRNFGDCDSVGGGISELRIHYGPGYRIYFGEKDCAKAILLVAGDKSTQEQDINKAKLYWAQYNKKPLEIAL